MSPSAEEPDPAKVGLITGLLGYLATIHTFYQAALLILLGAALLVGFLIYEARHQIVEAAYVLMMPPPRVTLASPEALRAAAEHVHRELGAIGVAVWETDLIRNRRTLVVGIAAPAVQAGFPTKEGDVTPLLARGHRTLNAMTIALLDGEVPCFPPGEGFFLRAPSAEIAAALQEVCAVGVPPGPEALVGMLAVGFDAPLEPGRKSVVTATLRAVAATLVR